MAHFSDLGLARLTFPNRATSPLDLPELSLELWSWHSLTQQALKEALRDGRVTRFPPMDLRSGTPFQQRVWRILRTIPPGETMTYAEVALAIHQPKAVRAVGGACGANPIPVLIPCHRVLAVNRKIGGFSGGINWKKTLLSIEGHEGFKELF